MKIILTAMTASIMATAIKAGEIAYVAPQAVALEEPAMMGGSGSWIIPLVIVALLALALTSGSCSTSQQPSLVGPTPTPTPTPC